MTTSLVTGGAGFIGSHVVKHLLNMGHEVIILDDLSGGFRENIPEGVIFRLGTITESSQVNALFALYKPDYVFHLAAYAAENLSHHIRRFNYTNNLIGSVNLINAAVNHNVKRFVFTSSAAVYGPVGNKYADEMMRPEPADPYGVSKLAVELDLACAWEMFGLPYTVFRCHNIYGERQNMADGYRNVIAIFMAQALKGQPLTIFGDGTQTRQFTYVGDVAPVIASCCEMGITENQTFNIGSPRSCTVNGVAAWVAGAVDPQSEKVHLPARHEVQHVHLDHRKFTEYFGQREWVMPWDGIQKMAQWARTQTLREPKPFEGIEIAKNMPESWRAYVD